MLGVIRQCTARPAWSGPWGARRRRLLQLLERKVASGTARRAHIAMTHDVRGVNRIAARESRDERVGRFDLPTRGPMLLEIADQTYAYALVIPPLLAGVRTG